MIKVTVVFKGATLGMSFYSKEDRLGVQDKILDARRRQVGQVVLRTSDGSVFLDPREVVGVLLEEVSD